MRRGDVPGLLADELFVTGMREWNRFRRFGLPHGRGYLHEKRLYLRVIEIFEQEYNDFLYSQTRT
jgi:hypothetical protein